jgi:hypothetical protein
MRLEFLHRFDGVVDQGESRGLAATVLCAHAEDVDLVFVGFVDFGEFGAEVVFANIGAIGVEDVAGADTIRLKLEAVLRVVDLHNHLLSRQQSICDKFPGADSDR